MSIEQSSGIPDTARKASFSKTENCVYVDKLPGGGRAVYDSKNPTAPPMRYTAGEWDAFVAGVKAGEFD